MQPAAPAPGRPERRHTADSLVADTLKRIGRDGRSRGQVAGIGWAQAEAAATLASNGGGSLAGIRDAVILCIMSEGAGDVRFLGAPTMKAVARYL